MDARRLEAALTALRALLGERLSTAADERLRHGTDASYHRPTRPTRSPTRARPTRSARWSRICAAPRRCR